MTIIAEAAASVGVTGNIASAFGLLGAAIGVGLIGTKAAEAVGRNPAASGKILVQAILGMALVEGLGVLALLFASKESEFSRSGSKSAAANPPIAMLPLLLAVTEAAGRSAAQPGMIEKFGIEPKFIVMQAISFLLLFVVLYKFGIKPTIATMEERNAKIASGLKHAEDMQAKLAAAQQESAAIVKKSQVEATRIIEDARKMAKDYVDKQTQEAAAKATDILTKAQQAIELEHKKMLADARSEIARLVVTTTERVLAKKLSDTDRAAYNDSASRELSSV